MPYFLLLKQFLSFHPEPIHLGDLLEAVHNTLKGKARKNRISLVIDVQHTPEFLVVDRKRMEQILIILLNTAIHYSGEGGEVRLSVSQGSDSGTTRWMVMDKSTGIHEEQLIGLLTDFYPLTHLYATREEGFGSSLALANRLIELQDGHLSIQKEKGGGIRYVAEIPDHPERLSASSALLASSNEQPVNSHPNRHSEPASSGR